MDVGSHDAWRVRDCDVVHPFERHSFSRESHLDLGYPRARTVRVRGGGKEGGPGGGGGRCINNSYILMNRPLPRSKNSFKFWCFLTYCPASSYFRPAGYIVVPQKSSIHPSIHSFIPPPIISYTVPSAPL